MKRIVVLCIVSLLLMTGCNTVKQKGIVVDKYPKTDLDVATSMASGVYVSEDQWFVKVKTPDGTRELRISNKSDYDKISIDTEYSWEELK